MNPHSASHIILVFMFRATVISGSGDLVIDAVLRPLPSGKIYDAYWVN